MFCFWDNFLRWRRVQKVSKYLPLNSIVCDIGCGKEAYFLKKFSPLIKKGIGLDEEIEDYNDPNLEFKKFKTTDSLPLENESCEVITMMAVIAMDIAICFTLCGSRSGERKQSKTDRRRE